MSDRRVGVMRGRRWTAGWLLASLMLLGIAMPGSAAAAECPYSDHLVLGNWESTIDGLDFWRACASITLESGYTVGPAGRVLLEAGERVTLRPGTRVQSGSTLRVSVWGDRGPPLANVSLFRSGPGAFWVTLPDGQERYCGAVCERLDFSSPAGLAIRVDSLPDAGAVLWSWGSLPCDQLSTNCQIVLEGDIQSQIGFEAADVSAITFSVPAAEAYEYVDLSTGIRVTVPAGATHQATSVRLHTATNARGERLFSVELLEPESWVDGLHTIMIDMTALSAEMLPEALRIEPLSSMAQTPYIFPRQPFVPYLLYSPSWFGSFSWSQWVPGRVENRLFPVEGLTCPVVLELVEGNSETKAWCGWKEHALTTARCTGQPGAADACGERAWPVILINGYQTFDGTGGLFSGDPDLDTSGADYWNDLPYALYLEDFAPYTFRWNTGQRFQDAAESLRHAVNEVRARHEGKPPVLVAHSLGGLVARTYAQGADSDPLASPPSESEVLGVITIATPHSGISQGETIQGNRYPAGVHSGGSLGATFIDRCRQISCYQAGLDGDYFPDLELGEQQDFRNLFGIYFAGETVHRLSYPALDGGGGMRVPLQVLIGLQETHIPGRAVKILTPGDGLITWQGQRAHPELSCINQTCANRPIGNVDAFVGNNPHVFGNSVTERLLGALHIGDLETLVPGPGTDIPPGFRPYAHSPSTDKGYMWTQTGIDRDQHVDVNPRQHDVLLVVLETVAEWTGSTPPPPVSTGLLNDTGITWSGHATSGNAGTCDPAHPAGQDCHYGRDARAAAGTLTKVGGGNAGFDFTKIANNGSVLPASATLGSGPNDWACTRDNVTGLIWEVKVNNSGHLRHQDHTYTWYDPNSLDGNPGSQNGGTCTGSACDTTGFVQVVNAQGLCGASDWRMPTPRELEGIVDYGRQSPAIDTGYFPNTPSSRFWSESPSANSSSSAWYVSFVYGNAVSVDRSVGRLVRLVRGGS